MYRTEEVVASLDGASLTEALSKLESFAIANELSSLALWSQAETLGYTSEIQQTLELPKYREVGVQWVDMLGRKMPIDFGGNIELAKMASKLPVHLGVAQLEAYRDKGMLINSPAVSSSLSAMLTDEWGGSVNLRGAFASAQSV